MNGTYPDINNLGEYASVEALWTAYPNGGIEGDYAMIGTTAAGFVKYRWNKYDRIWENAASITQSTARETETIQGDLTVNNDTTIGGDLEVRGTITSRDYVAPYVGLFATEAALKAAYPNPKTGWFAVVGDEVPGDLWRAADGTWTATGETGGSAFDYETLARLPQIGGVTLIGNKSAADLGLQTVANLQQTSIGEDSDTKYPSVTATKDFVNSSIATQTAHFLGTVEAADDTEAAAQTALATITATKTNNDYANVKVANTPQAGVDKYKRYKWNATTSAWVFEFDYNNSSFTAAQWAALNSGVNTGNLATCLAKQDALVSGTNIKTINGDSVLGGGNITIEAGLWQSGTGTNSVVQKGSSGTASGELAVAEGSETKANGDYSHAEGIYSEATGNHSHAEGFRGKASGTTSHAEGENTIASGQFSHVEGSSTRASGPCSHAEGSSSQAIGHCSHAEGYNTEASIYSHSEGYGTEACAFASHAGGYAGAGAGQVKSDGYAAFAHGYTHTADIDVVADGNGAIAMGLAGTKSITANGNGAIALGQGATATGADHIAIGDATASLDSTTNVDTLLSIEDKIKVYQASGTKTVGLEGLDFDKVTRSSDSATLTNILSSKESTSNKVTSMSSASTDTQYPSAKAVYDGLAEKADADDVPTKTSDLTNDSGFITATSIQGKADKVSSPTVGNFANLNSEGNIADSGSKASDFATALQGTNGDEAYQKVFVSGIGYDNLTATLQGYVDKGTAAIQGVKLNGTELTPDSNRKVNVVAYEKPSAGIPSSDLASAVQTSLGLADTAYQKPAAGIPSTDMASAVQTSLGLADTAYQKPAAGIPESDLASAVKKGLVFAVNYATTTYAEIVAARDAGRICVMWRYRWYYYTGQDSNSALVFSCITSDSVSSFVFLRNNSEVEGEKWTQTSFTIQTKGNLVTSWQATPDHSHYPSESLVYQALAAKAPLNDTVTHFADGGEAETLSARNHIIYNIDSRISDLTIQRDTTEGLAEGYEFRFYLNTGATVPSVTWSFSNLYWKGGSAPTLAANKCYEVSIVRMSCTVSGATKLYMGVAVEY